MAKTAEVNIDLLSEIKLDLVSLKAMVYTDSIASVCKVDIKAASIREGLSCFMEK